MGRSSRWTLSLLRSRKRSHRRTGSERVALYVYSFRCDERLGSSTTDVAPFSLDPQQCLHKTPLYRPCAGMRKAYLNDDSGHRFVWDYVELVEVLMKPALPRLPGPTGAKDGPAVQRAIPADRARAARKAKPVHLRAHRGEPSRPE